MERSRLKRAPFHGERRRQSDVAFLPKNHEEGQVPLTTELGLLLTDHKKREVSDRCVLTNEDGKPEGHFLRKFKVIAKRAGLNCGQCKTTIREGRYDNHLKWKPRARFGPCARNIISTDFARRRLPTGCALALI